MFVEVAFHEGAHLLAAKLVGYTPFSLKVGRGPLLLGRRFCGVDVRLHLFPFVGMVHSRMSVPGLRWRGAFFSIAGLLADFALLLVVLNLAGFKAGAPDASRTTPLDYFFALLAVYQIVVIAVNLIPMNVVIEKTTIPNDGKQFLGYLTGRTLADWKAYEAAVRRYDATFQLGESWILGGDQAMSFLIIRAEEDLTAGRYAEGAEKFLRLVEEPRVHPGEKAMYLDRIACIPILRGDKGLLSRAVDWARRAHELVPQSRTIQGTYGAALVENGAHAEGIRLLMPLTSEDNTPLDQTLSSCFVAKALHAQGHAVEAREWLRRARSSSEQYPAVIERIETELAGV
jgi:Zn-dependent protease